jgi:hypothetical protein
MLLIRAAVSVSVLFLAGCANTQPTKPAAARPPGVAAQPKGVDPQNAYEPRSAPGDGQKFLSRMEGEWDVVKTFYPRESAPAVSRGRCTQHMIHGGRFLQSDFVFNDANGDTTGMGVIGFDPQTSKFTSFWTDSRSTRVSIRQSEAGFDGKAIVLFGQSLGNPPPSEAARRSRTTSTLEDGDRRLIHRQVSISPDGQERAVMQLEMTRH